jgi:quinoprotein glucose dehydrogenase
MPNARGVRSLLLALSIAAACRPGTPSTPIEWTANGRDLEGSRFAPAAQITRDNVARLDVAWTYQTGEIEARFATTKPTSFEATPLVADGVMYVGTPIGRVIALDAATGAERWTFDPQIDRTIEYGDFASRGVSMWIDESAADDAPCRHRIFVAAPDAGLWALDAADGRPCAAFGRDGRVDLREGLRIRPFEPAAYSMTSPPLVMSGLVIAGSSIGDNSRPAPASGEVRAFDARTGRLRWTWDPVPQDPADPAFGEWRGTMAHRTGSANAWTMLAGDPQRDLVFVPTSSAAPDYFGGLRLGDNRYASSLVALRGSSGEVVWSFQTVHHDLWDYDNAAPPSLVTITRDGVATPAVVQATKTGMLFVLHRETGQPLIPVAERPVPASDIPGETASPTQPFSTTAVSPQRFTTDQIWGVTEADRVACRAVIEGLRNDGPFTPPSTRGTLVLPSNVGGAHWGGVAIDPERQLAIVPVNRVAAMVQLIPREGFDLEQARGAEQRLGDVFEYNMMQGTPYVMRRRLLLAPSRLPCTPPPFGSLVAVDLRTGQIRWDVPLGSMAGIVDPSVASQVAADWGSPNLGGPIVTAGGLVFVGATLDRRLRAFDVETGREVWSGELPQSAKATPMSYQLANGEQFVAVTAGGGGAWGTGDYVVAFRLRD